tara:strand:- start:395 stop:508 length:114 start_codon:yes stop_codon:yes gene_type:complete
MMNKPNFISSRKTGVNCAIKKLNAKLQNVVSETPFAR